MTKLSSTAPRQNPFKHSEDPRSSRPAGVLGSSSDPVVTGGYVGNSNINTQQIKAKLPRIWGCVQERGVL